MARPRAVFLSPILPVPTGNGLSMRMSVFLEALALIADVDLVVIPVAGEMKKFADASFYERLNVRLHLLSLSEGVDSHFSLLSMIPDGMARVQAFRDYAKPSMARFLTGPVKSAVEAILKSRRPDIVHIGRSYLSPLVDLAPSNASLSLDLDEDDMSSFNSLAGLAFERGDHALGFWLRQEGHASDLFISDFGKRFQQIFVASTRERRLLGLRHPGLSFDVARNAVEIPRRSSPLDGADDCLFVGTLSYPPNLNGVIWFVEKVFPRLQARKAWKGNLLIVGDNAPPAILSLSRHPRINLLGPVRELGAVYKRAAIAIAPMRAGGGTRLKVLEAAAHNVASVATHAAAEGLEWPEGTGGWIASTVDQFVASFEEAVSNRRQRAERASLGRKWVELHHSRSRVVSEIAAKLQPLS